MGKRRSTTKKRDIPGTSTDTKVRFVLYGMEMLDKKVHISGKSGRIYLPSTWIGCKVKVVRVC